MLCVVEGGMGVGRGVGLREGEPGLLSEGDSLVLSALWALPFWVMTPTAEAQAVPQAICKQQQPCRGPLTDQ